MIKLKCKLGFAGSVLCSVSLRFYIFHFYYWLVTVVLYFSSWMMVPFVIRLILVLFQLCSYERYFLSKGHCCVYFSSLCVCCYKSLAVPLTSILSEQTHVSFSVTNWYTSLQVLFNIIEFQSSREIESSVTFFDCAKQVSCINWSRELNLVVKKHPWSRTLWGVLYNKVLS